MHKLPGFFVGLRFTCRFQPVGETRKVIEYKRLAKLARGFRGSPLAGSHEHGAASHFPSCLKIAQAIADHPCPFKTFHSQCVSYLREQAGLGFAAVASIIGAMWAIGDMGDFPSSFLHQLYHSFMHQLEDRFIVITARYA